MIATGRCDGDERLTGEEYDAQVKDEASIRDAS